MLTIDCCTTCGVVGPAALFEADPDDPWHCYCRDYEACWRRVEEQRRAAAADADALDVDVPF